MRDFAWVAFVLVLGCQGAPEDSGGAVELGPEFVLEDQGLGALSNGGDCARLGTSLIGDPAALGAAYAAQLGVTPVPEIDLDARIAVLGWVDGCFGADARLDVDRVTDAPDTLVVRYVLTGVEPTGTAPRTPYVLFSVARLGYQTVEATVQLPAR